MLKKLAIAVVGAGLIVSLAACKKESTAPSNDNGGSSASMPSNMGSSATTQTTGGSNASTMTTTDDSSNSGMYGSSTASDSGASN